MSIEQTPSKAMSRFAKVIRRIADTAWLLMAAILVLMFFLFTRSIHIAEAALAFALMLFAAAVLPNRGADAQNAPAQSQLAPNRLPDVVRQFADAMADPCIILDARTNVLHCNRAAQQQFPAVAPDRPLAFSLRAPSLLSTLEKVLKTGAPQSAEMHQTVPQENWYKIDVALFGDQDRRDWVLIAMRSLTEQKRVENMRVDFIANASHELRTPLTSLVGFIDTLQGPAAKDAEARARFLNIMRGQAARMSNLIDDLLSLSRIELRQHVRPSEQLDLMPIMREVAEGLQMQARDAGVRIEVKADLADPAEILGERGEIYEVFENLIDNAIKYGAEGEAVTLTIDASDRAGFAYRVQVIDKGPGIAEEHVPRLTERFYRVDAESSRKKKGTGLGLAIVKHILNRHGAQMAIRSKLGQGTTVELHFPAVSPR